MTILITGGMGYIGSHTAVVLAQAGFSVLLFDNLSNSKAQVQENIQTILGKPISFIQGDVRDTVLLEDIFKSYQVHSVIHFAGHKSVAESVISPEIYYSNNVKGSISLVEAMLKNNVKELVFSSSATVYGEPAYLPYDEQHPLKPINPYGRSKLQVEEMLTDVANSNSTLSISLLRYFNPVGAHSSGLIGETLDQTPNNLMPYVLKVAAGQIPTLNIFGNDYLTRDGTGERDYIHVMDLAFGHLKALEFLSKNKGIHIHNLGTGKGVTVLELLKTFEQINNLKVPYQFTVRRPGDLPSYYSDSKKAAMELGWIAQHSLQDMCSSAWNYAQQSQ